MGSNLPGISFACSILLSLFIPLRRVRGNVANLAIIAWLVGSNLVHAINALIWAGNVDIHVPIWCDVVTRLLLGASVALPGVCLTMSRRLELYSSNRPMPKSRRIDFWIDFSLCYIFPTIHSLIHFIVQDRRFDLVADFGCFASTHPSSIGLLITGFPPLVLTITSFIFLGLAIRNSSRHNSYLFAAHIETRSPLTSSLFFRRLSTCFVTNTVIFMVGLFTLFSTTSTEPWTSWSPVHARMWVIQILTSPGDIRPLQLTWWSVPIVSIVYLILLFTIGEETRDIIKYLRELSKKYPKPKPSSVFVLPLHVSKPPTPPPRNPRRALDLKSGWDDMLDPEPRKPWVLGSKTSSVFNFSPSSRTPSPSPTAPKAKEKFEDAAFAASTMDYLTSPTAQTLGIASPPTPPPLVVRPSRKWVKEKEIPYHPFCPPPRNDVHDAPAPVPVPVPVPTSSACSILGGTPPTISSVLNAAWPEPPASIPLSPVLLKSRTVSPPSAPLTKSYPRSPSPPSSVPVSPKSSIDSDIRSGHALSPEVTPLVHNQNRLSSRPFVHSAGNGAPPQPLRKKKTLKDGKRPSMKNLKKGLGMGTGPEMGDGIYMTVVSETVLQS